MIKIGCNSLSVRDMGVEDFIRTCYELRLDSVDFHESAFASREPAYLASIKLSASSTACRSPTSASAGCSTAQPRSGRRTPTTRRA